MISKLDYVIWGYKKTPNACVVKTFKGVKDVWEINEGISRANAFPENAIFCMDPDRPYDTLLLDNIQNIHQLIVGSRRLKEFLEIRKLPKVEYLPVTILDHKGRAASKDYFIINPIDPVDCLDLSKCGVDWSSLDEEMINSVERLVFDESKVDLTREIFRSKYFYDITIVRRELAEVITREGFTGIRWIEQSKYPEL